MKANHDPFIKKFNTLDNLCKSKYPECKGDNFSAMRKFADSLNPSDKSTLKSIIHLRNTIHNERDLVSINPSCQKFLDGLINGLRSGTRGPIDSNLENLKKSNIDKMNGMMRGLQSKIHMVSFSEQQRIRGDLQRYIEQEKRVASVDKAKEFYFNFLNYYNSIRNMPSVKEARSAQISNALARKRQEALSELTYAYREAVSDMEEEYSFLQRGKYRKKLDAVFSRYRERISTCNDFDILDDLPSDAESDFIDCYY